MAADDRRFIGFKNSKKGPRNVKTAVVTIETKTQLPTPKGQKQWQADHIYNLGILSSLAKADKPVGVKVDAWKTVQEAVFGDEPQVSRIRVHHHKPVFTVVLHEWKRKRPKK